MVLAHGGALKRFGVVWLKRFGVVLCGLVWFNPPSRLKGNHQPVSGVDPPELVKILYTPSG